MLQYLEEIEIQASVGEVFAKLTDSKAISEWFPGVKSFEYGPGKRHFKMKMDMHNQTSTGTAHHARYKSYDGHVTAYFKDREFGIEFGEASFVNRMIFRLQSSGSGSTRVGLEVTLTYQLVFAEKIARFLSWIGRAKVKNTLKGLKLNCEQTEGIQKGKPLKISPRFIALFFFVDLLIVGSVLWFLYGGGAETLGIAL